MFVKPVCDVVMFVQVLNLSRMAVDRCTAAAGVAAARDLLRTDISHTKKGKGSPCSITERRVPELIPVLGSQRAGDVNHKPDGRLPLLSARPAVTPATFKRTAINFAAW